MGCWSRVALKKINRFSAQELERGKGHSLILGAKQRVVTNIDIVNKSLPGQVLPKRIVCAEPSPDVAQGVSDAIKVGIAASVARKGSGSFNFGSSSAASVAQLGERLATIQLLRDMSYRNCEAYANGAISAASYTILNSRLHKTIVTLLTSEMTAGAFGRSLAQIGGSADTSGGESAATAKARREFKEAVERYETAKDKQNKLAAANNPDPAEVKQVDKEVTAAKDALADKAVKLAASRAGASSTGATASAGKGGSLGQLSGARPTNVSADLREIHRQFMDDNSFGTLMDACATELNRQNFFVTVEEPKNPIEPQEKEHIHDFKVSRNPAFGKICIDKILPRAVRIADQESIGKIMVQGMRARSIESATLIRAEAGRVEQINKLLTQCKTANADTKPICKAAAASLPKTAQPVGTTVAGKNTLLNQILGYLTAASKIRASSDNIKHFATLVEKCNSAKGELQKHCVTQIRAIQLLSTKSLPRKKK